MLLKAERSVPRLMRWCHLDDQLNALVSVSDGRDLETACQERETYTLSETDLFVPNWDRVILRKMLVAVGLVGSAVKGGRIRMAGETKGASRDGSVKPGTSR
jgi:hypothetical protein